MKTKPKNCTYPDCFHCPYIDCRYDRLEVQDYTESNNRDYFLYEDSTGNKLHKSEDKEYRMARQVAYERTKRKHRDRREYNKKYYLEHRDKIKENKRDKYKTSDNTKKCKRWRKKHKEYEKERQRMYYLSNRERKLAYAKERYERKKLLSANV